MPAPPTRLMIEECLLGWKEFEMEVMARPQGPVCRHLLDREFRPPQGRAHGRLHHHRRPRHDTQPTRSINSCADASFAVIREIGVETGGSNNPVFRESRERPHGRDRDESAREPVPPPSPPRPPVSPLARSPPNSPWATASTSSKNDITRETPASFEPTIGLRRGEDSALYLRKNSPTPTTPSPPR